MKKGRNKSPEQLREQIAAQQDRPAAEGNERSAEGEELRTPARGEFFENLTKVAKPS